MKAWAASRTPPGKEDPGIFPPLVVMAVKAIACELPRTLELPLSRLFVPDIRDEVIRRGIAATISGSTLWRGRDQDAIRPWTYRSWIFPRDPDFEAKAGRVLDLYGRSFEGRALGEPEFVVSADEKTSIQARCRCHPSLPPAKSRPMSVEHEYERGGALQYLVGWDVHRAKLFGRCEERNGIEPFDRLVAQVMATEPYASAKRVFWVVDNGSSHRGKASIERLEARYTKRRHRRLRLIHCPVHSSWLNQVEIYNSIIQRKVLTPNDFVDLNEVERRLLAFERRYEQAATPFEWKFTRQDLADLMKRLTAKEAQRPAA